MKKKLRALIWTMGIHSNYICNGYWQMTNKQKKLYRKITGLRHSTAVRLLEKARG
jgi:hypothetical protein